MAGPDAKTDSEVPVGGETNFGVGDDTKSDVDAKVDASTVAGVVGRVTASTREKTDIENNTNTDAEVKAEVPSKSDTAVVEDKTDVDSKADASKAAVATTTDEVVKPVVGEKAEKTADSEPPAEGDAAIADDPWAVDIEPPAAAAEPAVTSVPPAATHGVDGGEGGKDGEEGDVDIMDVDGSAPVAGGGASIQGKDVAAPPAGVVYLGRLVRKSFGGVPYLGRVFHYDREENWYKVRYEDGDAEDLEVPEVEKLLLSGEEETAANADIETWSETNKATLMDERTEVAAEEATPNANKATLMDERTEVAAEEPTPNVAFRVDGPGAKVVGKSVLKDFEGVLTEGKITAFDEDTKKYTVEYEGTEHSLLEVLVWKGVESILVIGEDNYMPEEDMEEEEEVIEEGKAGEKVVSVVETQEPRAVLGGALGVTEAAAPQIEVANAVMEEMGMDEATVVVATGTISEAPGQVSDQVPAEVAVEVPQRMEEMGMDEAMIVAIGTEGGEGRAGEVEGEVQGHREGGGQGEVQAAAEAEVAAEAVEGSVAGAAGADEAAVAEGLAGGVTGA
ncbi:unnamed protein product [Closterium sp. Naga37s-1]|nr:unnamed protein product [Closterium sp. Naga37s-1]